MIREPGADGFAGEGHPFEHEPAPPEPRQLIPDPGGFVRGLALLALGIGGFAGGVASVQKAGWLATPLAAVLGACGVLATWAAAIHITGGERFDDHPWV